MSSSESEEGDVDVKRVLIHHVERYPIIYDSSAPGHSNRGALERAWADISSKMAIEQKGEFDHSFSFVSIRRNITPIR